MCGLVAVLGNEGRALALVEKGLSRMSRRGIRSRITGLRNGAIGHVRLPIVGVGAAHDQPVRSGDLTLAFVGEVLDFREIDPGMECDIELVVQRWKSAGPGCLTENDGFWHVVAHDDQSGLLVCIVDYLRQKPLYYRTDMPAVASEPDAAACLAPVTLNPLYLSDAMKWGYCPDPTLTPYQEVRCVPPGGCLTVREDGWTKVSVVDVLRPVATHDPITLRLEIRRAVVRRVCSSDVPVASLISGGLDSAIVRVLSDDHSRSSTHAYHVENGELEACRQVAPEASIISLSNVTLMKALDYMQEPIDLGSLVPQVALSDAIADAGGERVCLTGDGADEMFGGYGRASRYDSQASDVWRELVCWHLPRLDRVMMRNQIEIRSPFLARSVVRIALSLPWQARTNKQILRDLFRTVLPRGVADTPKRPLRTAQVEADRESRSRELVRMFVERSKEFTDA